MMKFNVSFFAVCALLCGRLPQLLAADASYAQFAAAAVPAENQYVLVINVYDWGAAADSVILHTEQRFAAEDINAEDFKVTKIDAPEAKARIGSGVPKGTRKVSEAYLSDAEGGRADGESNFITLKFSVMPEDLNADPFIRTMFHTGSLYGFKIENRKCGILIKERTAAVCADAARFTFEDFQSGSMKMRYAFWTPEAAAQSGKKIPLLVWFHGIGDGGENPYLPILGTKVKSLTEPAVQSYFPDGAAVLVPQAPLAWLVSDSLDLFGNHLLVPVDLGGIIGKVIEALLKAANCIFDTDLKLASGERVPRASISHYGGAVKALIDDFIAAHPYIDAERISVGGCSAGGYMTLNMLIQYPDFFAAGFPICAAYPDHALADSQLAELAKVPLWFTKTHNDPLLEIENYEGATVPRLAAMAPKDLHYTFFDDVRDLSGTYTDKDGAPYQFNGHSAWIYVLNDCVEADGLKLFEWLASQRRQ